MTNSEIGPITISSYHIKPITSVHRRRWGNLTFLIGYVTVLRQFLSSLSETHKKALLKNRTRNGHITCIHYEQFLFFKYMNILKDTQQERWRGSCPFRPAGLRVTQTQSPLPTWRESCSRDSHSRRNKESIHSRTAEVSTVHPILQCLFAVYLCTNSSSSRVDSIKMPTMHHNHNTQHDEFHSLARLAESSLD